MTTDVVTPDAAALAERFVSARVERKPIPVLNQDVSLTHEQAYEVQQRFVQLWCDRQRQRVRGYKVSLTSAETQATVDATEPTCGVLFEETVLESPATVSLGDFNGLLVEPELVFLLDEDLSSSPDRDEVLAKSRIAPALEVPEARYRDWYPATDIQVMDLIADNSAAGRLVVGEAVPAASVDVGAVAMELRREGQVVVTGSSAAVLGHPANAVVWLAAKLATRGERLTAGLMISSGTFVPPLVAEEGAFEASYAGVGDVRVTFDA